MATKMETHFLNEVEKLAAKKLKIFRKSLLRYILRAMLASMFIGFGVIVAFKTGNFFYLVHSPFAYPAAAFALLIFGTGLFAEPTVNGFLLSVVEKKMHAPVLELFFRGILCNWLVCLAFFIPIGLQGDGPKMFSMMLFVFCFFVSGYEHSIANMCTFAIALVVHHPETISWNGVIYNLIPVTLGNLIAEVG